MNMKSCVAHEKRYGMASHIKQPVECPKVD